MWIVLISINILFFVFIFLYIKWKFSYIDASRKQLDEKMLEMNRTAERNMAIMEKLAAQTGSRISESASDESISELHRQGFSPREIADRLKISIEEVEFVISFDRS
ncbi:MAG: hypothetical protein MJ215_04415 [Spirochaetia bacterium]|nr:hypothetical protein [Spirochaetia bacterium]